MFKSDFSNMVKLKFLVFSTSSVMFYMLEQSYIEKTLPLFYAVVCHLFINDIGGTGVCEEIEKCNMGEVGFTKYHFVSENGCLK